VSSNIRDEQRSTRIDFEHVIAVSFAEGPNVYDPEAATGAVMAHLRGMVVERCAADVELKMATAEVGSRWREGKADNELREARPTKTKGRGRREDRRAEGEAPRAQEAGARS